MGYRENFPHMIASLLASFGEPATYTPPGGLASDCVVLLDRGGGKSDPDLNLVVRTTGIISVPESAGLSIVRGGVFQIESEQWTILRVLNQNGGMLDLEVQREAR